MIEERRILVAAASAVTLAGLSTPTATWAQTSPVGGLEEVVVTARKRVETFLEAPVSLSAITAQQIDQKNIQNVNDLADFTPSLTVQNAGQFSQGRAYQTIVVRGMTPQAGQAATTSVFINGAPVSSGRVSGIEDVERVEVIRGPQSAYFGRTTFAGAVNVVTKDPSTTFKGRISGILGQDNWAEIRGTVEGPILGDKLAGRLSGRYFRRDGQYDDSLHPGRRFGDQSTKEFSFNLVAKPTENFTAKLLGIYFNDEDGQATSAKFSKKYFNCNAGAAPAGTFNYLCGQAPKLNLATVGANTNIDASFRSLVLNNSTGALTPIFGDNIGLDHGGTVNRVYHGSLSLDYDIAGLGVLSSITSVNQLKSVDIFDFTAESNPVTGRFLGLRNLLSQDAAQELRLTSHQTQRFRWTVGGSYSHSRRMFSTSLQSAFGLANPLDGAPQVADTYGIFFGGAFDITSRLILNVEGRYQNDKIELRSRGRGGKAETLILAGTFKNFLPRVIVQYKFSPDRQVYVTWARGANPGQFNQQFLTTPQATLNILRTAFNAKPVADPERIENYEVGFKGRLWGNRAQFTVAAYYAKWEDQIVTQSVQIPLVDTQGRPTGAISQFSFASNIGETILKGVELEGSASVNEHLIIDGAASVNDSDIKKFYCATCLSLQGRADASGRSLPGYSKWKANVGAEYHAQVTDSLDWYARGDYAYASGQWDSAANLVQSGDRHIVNLRAGLRTDRYYFEAFINNALDNKAYLNIDNTVDVSNGGRALLLGLPILRELGVRAEYRF